MSEVIEDLGHLDNWDNASDSDRAMVYTLLNTVREAGVCNMLSASHYLTEHLNLGKSVAKKALRAYMDSKFAAC